MDTEDKMRGKIYASAAIMVLMIASLSGCGARDAAVKATGDDGVSCSVIAGNARYKWEECHVPDGRTVKCLTKQGSSQSAMSCDWANAKGGSTGSTD